MTRVFISDSRTDEKFARLLATDLDRLGAALAWAFESGAGNTPTVLDMLERHYRAIYDYRANMLRYISWPAGILLLGLTVGFVVYAVFSPAVALVQNLVQYLYP